MLPWLLLAVFAWTLEATKGVHPDNEYLFQNSTFTCDDGKVIPIAKVNDGYCDCANGEDEPGTSACTMATPHAKTFFCPNDGFRPSFIYRSQVDDGICDCCDGSDESSGKCPNTCDVKRDSEEQAIASRQKALADGGLKKMELIKQGQAERRRNQRDITRMEQRIAVLQTEIAEKVSVKSSIREFNPMNERAFEAFQGLFGREVLIRCVLADGSCIKWQPIENDLANDELSCASEIDADVDGLCLCDDEKSYYLPDGHLPMTCNFFCFFKGHALSLTEYDFTTNDLEVEREACHEEIDSLNAISKADYGVYDEFLPYRNLSVSKEVGEYIYTISFFGRITQKNRSDDTEVCCGEWKGFGESNYSDWGSSSDYSLLEFENGQTSWNGLVRSAQVRLTCGQVDEIVEVGEDQPCKYAIVMRSPLACDSPSDHGEL